MTTHTALAALERRQRVKELHSEGMSNREISMSLRITRNTVLRDLNALGLESHFSNKNPHAAPTEKKRPAMPGAGRPRSETTILLAKNGLHDYRDTFDEMQIAILEMVVEGKRNAEIATELGVTEFKVDNMIAAVKLRNKKEGKILRTAAAHAARREEIKKLHETGMFTKDIAVALGMSRNSVYYDLEYLGLKSNGLGFQPMPTIDLFSRKEAKEVCKRTEKRVMERRLARGMTIADICAVDSSDRQYILDQFNYIGLEIPEGEAWVLDRITKERRPWEPSKRMRKETTFVTSQDSWNKKGRN